MSGDTRLYASAIALVSGIYSIGSAIADGMGVMPMGDAIMLIVGVVVLVHGAMSWDGGMVAIAVLMLTSGLIMSRRERM